jgi:hypothetical protein
MHGQLGPRWDSMEDMGDESKATHYVCASCGESFSPEQKAELDAGAGDRLRDRLG